MNLNNLNNNFETTKVEYINEEVYYLDRDFDIIEFCKVVLNFKN